MALAPENQSVSHRFNPDADNNSDLIAPSSEDEAEAPQQETSNSPGAEAASLPQVPAAPAAGNLVAHLFVWQRRLQRAHEVGPERSGIPGIGCRWAPRK